MFETASDIVLVQIIDTVFDGWRATLLRSYWSVSEDEAAQYDGEDLFIVEPERSCIVGAHRTKGVRLDPGGAYLLFLQRLPPERLRPAQRRYQIMPCARPFAVGEDVLTGALLTPFLPEDLLQPASHSFPFELVEGWLRVARQAIRDQGRADSSVTIVCPTMKEGRSEHPWGMCLYDHLRNCEGDPGTEAVGLLMLHSAGVPLILIDLETLACGDQPDSCAGDPSVAAAALHVAAERKLPYARTALLRGLRHPHGMVQETVLYELRNFMDDDAVAHIRAYLARLGDAALAKVEPTILQPFPNDDDIPYLMAIYSLLDGDSEAALKLLTDEFAAPSARGERRKMLILSMLESRKSDALLLFLIRTYGGYTETIRNEISLYLSCLNIKRFVDTLKEQYLANVASPQGRLLPAQLLTSDALFGQNAEFIVASMLYDQDFEVRQTAQDAVIRNDASSHAYHVIRSYFIDIAQQRQIYRKRTREWIYQHGPLIEQRYLAEQDPAVRRVLLSGLMIVYPESAGLADLCTAREAKQTEAISCNLLCHPGMFRCSADQRRMERCSVDAQGSFVWETADDCGTWGCTEASHEDLCAVEGLTPTMGVIFAPQSFTSTQCEEDSQRSVAVCNQCPVGADEWQKCVSDTVRRLCGLGSSYQIVERRCEAGSVCRTAGAGRAYCRSSSAL